MKIESTKAYRILEGQLAKLQQKEERQREEFKATKKEMNEALGENPSSTLSNYQQQLVNAFNTAARAVRSPTSHPERGALGGITCCSNYLTKTSCTI